MGRITANAVTRKRADFGLVTNHNNDCGVKTEMSKSEKLNDGKHPDVRVDSEPEWNSINWSHTEKAVARLQARIVKAQQEGRYGKVKSLNRILTRSFAAKALAVKRVTSNRGSKTPGVDGETWNTNERKAQAILELQQDSYRAKPLRRKYIHKQGSDKKRPLGIPTMKDRAMQAVYSTGLAPVAEATSDPNSYGFRPCRCCQDAIDQIAGMMSRSTRPQWILEGDIKGCFDNISHDWIMEHIPVEKRILAQWLKCGYIEDHRLYYNEAGTPQGGIISPVIANMVLDGIETMLNRKFKVWTIVNGKPGWKSPNKDQNRHVNFVRYADDFIVTGDSEEFLEKEVKPMIRDFLAKRGLELSEKKTLITHIETGFDFLGFNIRTYNGKLVIKPSESRVKRFKQKVDEVFKNNRNVQTIYLIGRLNPMLRGWANYYRFVSSSKEFSSLSNWMWQKVWHWACRRHPKKSKTWVKQKYFTRIGNRDWILFDMDEKGNRITLFDPKDVKILRHKKIKSGANPYATEDAEYFAKRKESGTVGCRVANSSDIDRAGC